MIIPKKRLSEFIKYHIEGDCDCNVVVLKKYAVNKNLNNQQIWNLCYFFSITYSVPSAVVLFENRANIAQISQHDIVFQSDRKWMGFQDRFARAIEFYRVMPSFEEFLGNNSQNGIFSLRSAYLDICKNWFYFKRFSAFMFIETLVGVLSIPIIQDLKLDWNQGDTATSGMLNLLGLDIQADAFDRSGKLFVDCAVLDSAMNMLQHKFLEFGGDSNITSIETTLSAYRKHFKQSRYNGFYLDRMLEELHKMQAKFPKVVSEIFQIRAQCFHRSVLGECNNWQGIRTNLKKRYQKTGRIFYGH